MKYLLPITAAALLAGCAGSSASIAGKGPFVGRENIFQAHRMALNQAGDDYRCEESMLKVRRDIARDKRLSDRDLEEELARVGKPRPNAYYPSPGTACGTLGFREALLGAIKDRKAKK